MEEDDLTASQTAPLRLRSSLKKATEDQTDGQPVVEPLVENAPASPPKKKTVTIVETPSREERSLKLAQQLDATSEKTDLTDSSAEAMQDSSVTALVAETPDLSSGLPAITVSNVNLEQPLPVGEATAPHEVGQSSSVLALPDQDLNPTEAMPDEHQDQNEVVSQTQLTADQPYQSTAAMDEEWIRAIVRDEIAKEKEKKAQEENIDRRRKQLLYERQQRDLLRETATDHAQSLISRVNPILSFEQRECRAPIPDGVNFNFRSLLRRRL